MSNITSYLLANVYSSFSPALNTAAVCMVNGQETPCGPWVSVLGSGILIFWLAFLIVMVTATWKVFTKAGQPGWASIVPIYNLVVMIQIAKKPIWWIFLVFVPIVNIVIGLIVTYNFAKMFGKGFGFTLGLIILPFIFYPILGFGSSKYQGESYAPTPTPLS